MTINMTRDVTGKAVLNNDREALNKYKVERLYYRKIDKLHSDITEIKQTLINISARIEQLEMGTDNG